MREVDEVLGISIPFVLLFTSSIALAFGAAVLMPTDCATSKVENKMLYMPVSNIFFMTFFISIDANGLGNQRG